MSLTSALNTVVTGLRATQSSLDVVSQNISYANQPGYTRKLSYQQTIIGDDRILGTESGKLTRVTDELLLGNVRESNAQFSASSIQADYLSRLESALGTPGNPYSLNEVFNSFINSAQSLATTPESSISRTTLLSDAQQLGQKLNDLSRFVQELRSSAENEINDKVNYANDLLSQLHEVNQQITSASIDGDNPVYAKDKRDEILNDLSELIEIDVRHKEFNNISVTTKSGVILYDNTPRPIEFDGRNSLSPSDKWSSNPDERTVGTITVGFGTSAVDILNDSRFKTSGALGSLVELRDDILPQAQAQLDILASSIATSLSNYKVEGNAVTSGAQEGFEFDLGSLQTGNNLSITVNENGSERTIGFVKVDDAASLPLDPSAYPQFDEVVGIDFSSGTAQAITDIGTALGANFTVSNPSGDVISILDDGATGNSDVLSGATETTITTLDSGELALPLFTDGASSNSIFTNNPDTNQIQGFASRITVNPGLINDPSKLVEFSLNTPESDSRRPQYIVDSLTQSRKAFSPRTDIGTQQSPFVGTVSDLANQIMSYQSAQVANKERVNEGREVIYNNLNSKYLEKTGVNIDDELAQLINIQNAYAANARVISVVDEMMKTLINTVG